MSMPPGCILALVDHPNVDIVLMPVLAELIERGHRVSAMVLDHGREERLHAAGFATTRDAAALDSFLAAGGPRLFLNAADQVPQHARGVRCDLQCRESGVPSLTVQHATFAVARDVPYGAHLAFAADRMAVHGDDDAAHYAASGIDPRRLVVTGAPAYDALARVRAQHLPVGEGIAVFGQTQTWVGPRSTLGHDPEAWCAGIARLYEVLAARFPGSPVRVKPHPAEEAHGLADLWRCSVPAALTGRVEVVPPTADNAQLIAGSALVLSFSASVWLEARCLDRAAVYFSLRDRTGAAAADLAALGGTWLPGRGLDLADRLESKLDRLAELARAPQAADEAQLRRYVGPLDGGAAARVADLAERMLVEGPPDVVVPDLVFDSPEARPRLLRRQAGYARYVHLQSLADEVTAAGVEHPRVLELAPEGSDLVAHLPLAVHERRGGLLAGTDLPGGPYDVVVAPDLWQEGLPPDPVAEIIAMIALARRRVVFSVAVDAIDEMHELAVRLLQRGPLVDAPPPCRPGADGVVALCRATGIHARVHGIHHTTSYCQALVVENLGLEADSLAAVRLALQASGYQKERCAGGVRLVFVLDRTVPKGGAA